MRRILLATLGPALLALLAPPTGGVPLRVEGFDASIRPG